MQLKTFSHPDVVNKTVLLRVDFNVPLRIEGGRTVVANDLRIKASLATIQSLVKAGAKVVILSHLGRPKGQVSSELSLQPVATHLSQLLDQPVAFVDDCVGIKVTAAKNELQPGQVLVLENTRFHSEEKKNDSEFSKALTIGCDVFVNDAFAAIHRSHASTVGVTKHLPCFAGQGLQKEVTTLFSLLEDPARPFVLVVGGAKISDKSQALVNLQQVADLILIGGGVANLFLKADQFDVADSYLETDQKTNPVGFASELLALGRQQRFLKDGYIPLPKILTPIDVIAGRSLKTRRPEVISLAGRDVQLDVRADLMYLDIGPKTIRLYQELLTQAKTIFWNGPMGVFEHDVTAQGTLQVGQAIAKSRATSIIGGGDTLRAADQFSLTGQFNHVSTGGGASLELLSGQRLPGLAPLYQ